jgi:hypothetical protein
MGMMISEPTFLSVNTSSTYVSDGILAADERGNIHEVSLPASGMADATIKTIGSLRTASDAGTTRSYSNPYGVCVGLNRTAQKAVWVGGGTADIGCWRNPMNGEEKNRARDNIDRAVRNSQQMLFGFKLPSAAEGISTRDKWTDLSSPGAQASPFGWYLPLEPDEYATVRPIMFQGTMYAATFRENKGGSQFGGVSRLYAIDIESGSPCRWGVEGNRDMFIEFKDVKINGFTLSRVGAVDTLVISYNGEPKAARQSNGALTDVGGPLETNNMQLILRYDSEDFPWEDPEDEDGGGIFCPVKNSNTVISYWRYVEE